MKYWAHLMPYIYIYLNNISLQPYNNSNFERIENIEKNGKSLQYSKIGNFWTFEHHNGQKKQYKDNKTQQSTQMY